MIVKLASRIVAGALVFGSLACGSLGKSEGQGDLQARRLVELDQLSQQAGMPDAWQSRRAQVTKVSEPRPLDESK